MYIIKKYHLYYRNNINNCYKLQLKVKKKKNNYYTIFETLNCAQYLEALCRFVI